jgi:hypothetical protein
MMANNDQLASTNRDREACRIQAAALVAEHAALMEWETRLRQRQSGLEKREAEIAGRLDEKYQHVQGLHHQLGQGREQVRQERDEMAAQRQKLEQERHEVQVEREKLGRDYVRLKRTWKKRVRALRKKFHERQQEQERLQAELDSRAQKLDKQERQSRNAVEHERARLRLSREQFLEEHTQNHKERKQAEQARQEREAVLQQQLQNLLEEQRHWQSERHELEQKCSELRAEAQGLENRIVNARRLLPGVEPAQNLALPLDEPAPSHLRLHQAPPADDATEIAWHDHAHTLADYRMLLAEMYARLAHAEEDWKAKQLDAVAELETVAVQLQQQEDQLFERRRELENRSVQLGQEREQQQRQRRELERRSTESIIQQTLWQGEKARQQADWQSRERLLHRREIALADLLRRWQQRRREDIARVREILHAHETVQRQWQEQAEEYRNRCRALREGQQSLAEQVLALEQARVEFLDRVENAPAASKRVERLRRRWQSLSARPLREAGKHWKKLEAEQTKWQESMARFLHEIETVRQREHELAYRETESESFRRRIEQQAAEQEENQVMWQAVRASYEQQLADLRNEVERLAKELIVSGLDSRTSESMAA